MRLLRRAFVVPLLIVCALTGSALMGLTSRLGAQTVRGLVTRSGTPVSGAVVQLLDSTSAIVSRTITDDAGAYRVLAPRSGSYRLAARRVGVAPFTSAVFVLRAGETREVALSVDGVAVSLDTM
ncbi:MAG: carboxypeptidase regulatory-like domain-containing protein, partial [Gemmatimonadaceae bacterium]|nr:carboxypeptidase regulatory-like domain-containing protein [Gemmatimonadaceae bacterium]